MAGASKRRRPQAEPKLEGLEKRELLSRLGGRPHRPLPHRTVESSGTASFLGVSLSVRAPHRAFRPGQAIVFTITETNPSDHDVTVVSGSQNLVASIFHNGDEVWRNVSKSNDPATTLLALHPGQSRQLTVTWDGRFARTYLGPTPPSTGTFQLQVRIDGASAETTFQIRGH